jgi:CRISP-associated protein Cas1
MTARVISDLAILPRTADSWTFLYTEKVRVERADYAIELRDKESRTQVPVAALSALMLGPGSTITHAAVLALAECGCSVVWCGEGMARFYAHGLGETRRAHHLEAQATAWASPERHMEVVRRLYTMRFPESLDDDLTLEQVRGKEGARVRQAYADAAEAMGIAWQGRSYKRSDWGSADAVNRALSAANACLYGVCHAAIVATGFTTGLGFLHVGKQLSFVYDIADLYKVDVTVPVAFGAAKLNPPQLESYVRRLCRDTFLSSRLLERIVPDLRRVFGLAPQQARLVVHRGDVDVETDDQDGGATDTPGELWNAGQARIAGGQNFAAGDHDVASRRPLAKAWRGPLLDDPAEDALLAAGDDETDPL